MNIQTAPTTWILRPRVPVSPIPLRQRRDVEHIFIGIECGLRAAQFSPTISNLCTFFSCSERDVLSLRRRLIAKELMGGEGWSMAPTEYGLAILRLHRGSGRVKEERVLDPAPSKGGRPKGASTNIDSGPADRVAKCYQALQFIADNPGATQAAVSRSMNYSEARAADGARHFLAKLGNCEFIEGVVSAGEDSMGRPIRAKVYTITDAGRAKLDAWRAANGLSWRDVAVTIRGVTYANQTLAAEALGVTQSAVCTAAKRGALDTVGLRRKNRR